jgi:mRNA-degrading endonuclease RelE of RelBE toxin-antitoxin system
MRILPQRPKVQNPPLIKRLRGKHSHLWQFEMSRRLIWEVDDVTRTVKIVYFGLHPDWG